MPCVLCTTKHRTRGILIETREVSIPVKSGALPFFVETELNLWMLLAELGVILNSCMTILYYHFFDERLPGPVFNEKLQLLSAEQIKKINRFHRWQDAHASLFGKLLLQKGLNDLGILATPQQFQYTEYGKPFIEQCPVCFNISHAGNCVVCVLSTDKKTIGIDVEKIEPVNLYEFKNIWTVNEWEEIYNGNLETFYQYWTCKEAIIKADGKGLSIPLNMIEVRRPLGFFQDTVYYLKPVSLHPGFVINIASCDNMNMVVPVEVKCIEKI